MTQHSTPKERRRRLARRLAYNVSGVVAISVGLVGLGYVWLTSEHGRDTLRDFINAQTAADTMQVHIDKITALSLHGIGIENLSLTENDEILLAIKTAHIGINPYALLWQRVHITDITAPDIFFHRLPSASDDEPDEAVLPDIASWTLPNMRIDAVDAFIRFSGEPQETLSVKGNMNLEPKRILSSHVELDVKDQNDKSMVEIRFLPAKNTPLLFVRVDDQNGLFLNRFGGLEEKNPIEIVWQGAMKDAGNWQGSFKFFIPDMINADMSVSLTDMEHAPVLSLDGMVSPVVATDNTLHMKLDISDQELNLKADVPQWIEGDLVIQNPVIELQAKPSVQFIVHQGYDWNLKARLDSITEKEQSVSEYSDRLRLDAKGRLGRTKFSMQEMTVGNEMWEAKSDGYFHLAKSYWTGDMSIVLKDNSVRDILGVYPKAQAKIFWDQDKGLQVANGILDIKDVQGNFSAVLDPLQKLVVNLDAAASDIQPYFRGNVVLNASVTGTLDDLLFNVKAASDRITLESGMEIQGVQASFDGNMQENLLSVSALLPDGEYKVSTPIVIKETEYLFNPVKINLPLGEIDGKIAVAQNDDVQINADLRGQVEGQVVSLSTEVHTVNNADPDKKDVTSFLLKNLLVEWKKIKLRLQKPVLISQIADKIEWQQFLFDLNGGTLSLDGFYSPDQADVMLKAQSLPMSALDIPFDRGVIDGSVHLTGSEKAPDLKADLVLKNLVPKDIGTPDRPVSLSGTINGHFVDELLSVRSALNGGSDMRLNADMSLPMKLIPFALEKDAPLKGQAKGSIDLMSLIALAMVDGHELRGRGDIDLKVSGTISNPSVSGNVRVANGQYENAIYGTKLQNMALDLSVSASELVLRRMSANDTRRGTLTATGKIGLKPLDNPNIDLTIHSKKMQILNSPALVANATSAIFIKGRLDDLAISGDVNIHNAEVIVDDIVGSGDPYRDYTIIEKNLPAAKRQGNSTYRVQRAEASNPVRLDINVVAPNAIFVRGPGLDSEWKADLSIRGTTDRPRLNGTLSVLRGTYQFVDLMVRLSSKSQVIFSGDASNPELALSGIIPGRTLNATLEVSGTAQKPVVELTSDQGLPSDEILARVLFGRSASGLSPAQAVQVARILARLTGQAGAGFDPVGIMRKALGVDTFGVSMGDEDGAGPTVSAGKYISDDVYVSVEQGTTPNSSAVRSEIRLNDSLQLETEVNNAADSKVGVQWRWDY